MNDDDDKPPEKARKRIPPPDPPGDPIAPPAIILVVPRQTWGPYQIVVDPDLGEPHDMLCDDCGAIIGGRQLPIGQDISRPSGHVCGDCTTGRRHEEERRQADLAESSTGGRL